MIFDPSKFTAPAAKPLPVILLLDISGSMSGDKIRSLNLAVEEMIASFASQEKMETQILFSAITFGDGVVLYTPYTPASQVQWQPLSASGLTPMGKALETAKAMIEDKTITPSRAYRPVVVLVSDGHPTDSWEQPLAAFIGQGRSEKCDRMAMSIGSDADDAVLGRFVENTTHPLFYAESASRLREFFRLVTMSVTLRSVSANPNAVPTPEQIVLDGGSVQFATVYDSVADADDNNYW